MQFSTSEGVVGRAAFITSTNSITAANAVSRRPFPIIHAAPLGSVMVKAASAIIARTLASPRPIANTA